MLKQLIASDLELSREPSREPSRELSREQSRKLSRELPRELSHELSSLHAFRHNPRSRFQDKIWKGRQLLCYLATFSADYRRLS